MSVMPSIRLHACHALYARSHDSAYAMASPGVPRHQKTNGIRRRMCIRMMLVLVGMVVALAAAAAPSSPRISLDVRNVGASEGDGYTNTTASNGATYSYSTAAERAMAVMSRSRPAVG